MGCSSNNDESQIIENKNNDEDEIEKMNYNLKLKISEIYKSICIMASQDSIGVGFLILLYKGKQPFFCIICNENKITKEMIEYNKIIEVYYDNKRKKVKIELNKEERFIKGYKEYDIAFIEILPEDEIEEDYFLVPNLDYTDDFNKLEKEYIYMPQILKNGHIGYYFGEIDEINNNKFSYSTGRKLIYSGSIKSSRAGIPIFLENTTEVIGIHKIKNLDEEERYGIFIFPLIQLLQENISYKTKKYGNNLYTGNFFNNKRDGSGKYIYENGECYIGEWLRDQRHGKGKLYFKNGTIKYEGDFVNDKMEGNGKLIYEFGNCYYVGEFLANKENGKGTIYYNDGSIQYEGDFVLGKFEGDGKYIYKSGEYYIGKWLRSHKNGKGTMYYKNGNIKYHGYYINDKMEGKGKYIYEYKDCYYVGDFLNDKEHGKGKLYYKKDDTIKYEGDFIDGKYDGIGKLVYENGDYYLGQFMKGNKHGKGAEYYENDILKYKGYYVNNVLKKKYDDE